MKFDAGYGNRRAAGGHLIADGTVAQPIVFTSIKDDADGGDTNGDGNATSPAPGDWRGIFVTRAGAISTMPSCSTAADEPAALGLHRRRHLAQRRPVLSPLNVAIIDNAFYRRPEAWTRAA